MESFGFSSANIALFIGAFLVSYYYAGVGITLGYHRLLTHRSLKVPRWLEYLIVAGGYLCLMGSPIVWVAVHRLHHLKSDQPGDPHSPRDGFTHALYEWMFEMPKYQSDDEVKKVCSDLVQDPLYKHLGMAHKGDQALLCLGVNIAFRLAIILALGPVKGTIVVVANVLATFIVFWSTQFVNTFCHMEGHGYRTFETREDSRNVWWVGILAVGEGWHNNHHAMPKSARHGLNWKEFDITWITICVLEKLGLAKNVVRPNAAVQAAKRIRPKAGINAPGITARCVASPIDEDGVEDFNRSTLVGAGEHK